MRKISLCFDFGNSRCKCAIFERDVFLQEVILDQDHLLEAVIHTWNTFQPGACILSSVIHHDQAIDSFLHKKGSFLLLDHRTPLPIRNAYEKPELLGVDRLALVAGAWKEFPGQHNLVIAAGTCITFNFINRDGVFLGGSITPGLQMRFQSLATFTDQLPLVKASQDYPLIGYNTRQGILSGILHGAVAEVDGLIGFYQEKYARFNVLLTGGDMEFFERRLKSKIFADLFLSYKGLNSILSFNEVHNS
ncbi:MAG: type III pantothenate kinase [Chitinophagaceae bacterium]